MGKILVRGINMQQSERLIKSTDNEIVDLGEGLKRQLLGYNHELMLVRVWFDKGAEGYLHKHPHSQSTYIESGVFDVHVNGKVKRLSAGDAFFIPPEEMHGAVCIEEGVLIDTFSPIREDFL